MEYVDDSATTGKMLERMMDQIDVSHRDLCGKVKGAGLLDDKLDEALPVFDDDARDAPQKRPS